VHIGPSVEEPDFGPIAALVADIQRHVHFLDAMDEKTQSELAILNG
jgi:hypothetical protein